ncbi:hypothetical protein DL769_007118 [Monosporascus sp. CRB-8-3]|nr:hypothetical protein DL769_007118 [Monosporascus sp. CRB-8-3]
MAQNRPISDVTSRSRRTRRRSSPITTRWSATANSPRTTATATFWALDFDLRDRRELERKRRQLEEAKEQHWRWIRRPNDGPKDQEVPRNRRCWCRVREGIRAAITLIPERLRVRREFREEFNPRRATYE